MTPDVRANRDWELCFRSGEILLHALIDRRDIAERRKGHFSHTILESSTAEAGRFSPEAAKQADWLVGRWSRLFDEWVRAPAAYVFDDGYALLFFLSVLYANMNVLLRGQVDAHWPLRTTLTRWREGRGEDATTKAREAAGRFIARLAEWPPLREHYPGGLSPPHREAICQHYGFPTEFVDITLAYDVALFFAEDWKHLGHQPMPECGVIYAVPIHLIHRHASLVTLPPAVMRPTLQFGKFLKGDSRGVLETVERHRFTYRHASWPVARGLSQIGFDASPSLSQYLYPPSDPIEVIARDFRSW